MPEYKFGENAKGFRPHVSYQSYGELYVSSGRYVFETDPVNDIAILICPLPPYQIIVDVIVDTDNIYSGSNDWTLEVYERSTAYGGYSAIFETLIKIMSLTTGGLRGYMDSDPSWRPRLDRAFYHETWVGAALVSGGPGFVPGSVMTVHTLFRPADRSEF